MSGIYIPGMKIPRFGYREIRIHPDGTVTERPDCSIPGWEENLGKAVPVQPHGRLIDADALKQSHCTECTLYPNGCFEKTADGCDWASIAHINMMPTIIQADPAEEGETDET